MSQFLPWLKSKRERISISTVRFAPHLRVVNYSGGKEQREEQRTDITDHVTGQSTNWKRVKYPFDVMIGNYEVGRYMVCDVVYCVLGTFHYR